MKLRMLFPLLPVIFLISCGEWIPHEDGHSSEQMMESAEHRSDETINVAQLIGDDVQAAFDYFGNPTDSGPSGYHYEWHIFNQNSEGYVQIGHADEKIVTVFILGEKILNGSLAVGKSYNEIRELAAIKESIKVKDNGGEYRFDLSKNDLLERPLIQLADDTFAQLYFDRFLNQLVGVRLLDKQTLLAHRPYRMVYRGELKEMSEPNKTCKKEIEQMNTKQIFYITNALRERYGKSKLEWNDEVAEAAFLHSKDMKMNQYFDHESPTNGDLENRLKRNDVDYLLAGENIAAEYPDGIAAVMGWLNSEGHRETMFHDEFTHLGVGVYDNHYTQNFVAK